MRKRERERERERERGRERGLECESEYVTSHRCERLIFTGSSKQQQQQQQTHTHTNTHTYTPDGLGVGEDVLESHAQPIKTNTLGHVVCSICEENVGEGVAGSQRERERERERQAHTDTNTHRHTHIRTGDVVADLVAQHRGKHVIIVQGVEQSTVDHHVAA
jgi:hypothetical protein